MAEAERSITDTILGHIAETLDVERDALTPEANLRELGADSLDALDLTVALEAALRIELSDTAIAECLTVGDVVVACERATAQ